MVRQYATWPAPEFHVLAAEHFNIKPSPVPHAHGKDEQEECSGPPGAGI